MKRRDLEQHLRQHGCTFFQHGRRHYTWINPAKQLQSSIPRHAELNKLGTIRAICRELDVPMPKFR